jgi:hypothetical protein
VTGCINSTVYGFDENDQGGQFDVRYPNGALCTHGGYGASFIEQYVSLILVTSYGLSSSYLESNRRHHVSAFDAVPRQTTKRTAIATKTALDVLLLFRGLMTFRILECRVHE